MTTTAARVASLLAPARDTDTPDAELVRRFTADRDDRAFVELVRRHGPMVFGVCRRVLRDWHLAEDAFQAAFLVLARRASAISPPGAVAGWLHGVAYRVAKDSRRSALRRLNRERTVGEAPDPVAPELDPFDDRDLREVIDDELRKLPAKYRDLLVACDLEGRPRQPVAESLGIPEGTLSSRLTTARRMLADRLAKRGIAPVVVAGVAAGGSVVEACEVPRALLASAARIGCDATGTVPGSVAALASGAIRAMTIRTFLPYAAGILVAVAGAAALAAGLPDNPPADAPKPQPLAVVAAAEPEKAAPKPLPKGESKLLVWRKRELVMIDPDGKNEKVALKQKGGIHPHMLALSPDGTKVAIVQPAKDEDKAPAHLFLFELGKEDSGTDLGPAALVHWSADSKSLAVCTFDEAPKPDDIQAKHEILTLATNQRSAVQLPATHLMMGWSRDGKHFLTLKLGGDRKNPFSDVQVMNRDGTEHKKLTDGKTTIAYARFSPDGTRVLALLFKSKDETPAEKKARQDAGGREPRGTHELVVYDVASGKVAPVADVPLNGELQGVCWSPDGKKIAYTWREVHEGDPNELLKKETSSHLVTCDPDGQNQKTLLSETGQGAFEMTLVGVDWQFVAAEEKSDATPLAGKWKMVAVTDGGRDAPTEDAVLTFEKGKVVVKTEKRTMEAEIKLDPAKSPKWIDFTVRGQTMPGIYEIDGDTLKICMNQQGGGGRPTKLASEPNNSPNDLLWVLKREKP